MSTNHYVIDSSSLIQLNRNNPIDVFPSIWKKLEGLVNAQRLVAPKEVLFELGRTDDQLNAWAKKQKTMFKDPTPKQIELVQEILEKFPSLIDTESKYAADPWVIALAIELTTSPQKTLNPVKRIVVTEEKLRGNRVRIPLVCNEKSIESMDVVELFRTEGWKF